MRGANLRIHSPRLCDEERCNNKATCVVILDHQLLLRGRVVRMRVCAECAIKLSAEDSELARKLGQTTEPRYEVRDHR